jgi:hypothetical protein
MSIVRIILTFLCLITVHFSHAQSISDCEKNEAFQRKLNIFRYSLYADLLPQKERIVENMESFFSDTSSVIYKKLKKFYLDNDIEIKVNQIKELEKYSGTKIEFDNYKIDTSFNSILSDTTGFSYFSTVVASYYFVTFNPISYAFSIDNVLLARSKTPSEMGNSALINNFASPLIKTKKLKNNNWEITIDSYEYIIIHNYNLSDNKIKVTEIYKRY